MAQGEPGPLQSGYGRGRGRHHRHHHRLAVAVLQEGGGLPCGDQAGEHPAGLPCRPAQLQPAPPPRLHCEVLQGAVLTTALHEVAHCDVDAGTLAGPEGVVALPSPGEDVTKYLGLSVEPFDAANKNLVKMKKKNTVSQMIQSEF